MHGSGAMSIANYSQFQNPMLNQSINRGDSLSQYGGIENHNNNFLPPSARSEVNL